jgi:hypothetical protein
MTTKSLLLQLRCAKTVSSDKLTREANRVQTWHSIGPGGVSGSLRATPTVDPIVLRKALSFLVGYAGADYQIPVGRLIQSLL